MKKSTSSPQLSTLFCKVHPPCKVGSVATHAFIHPMEMVDFATQTIIDDLQVQSIAHVTAFQAGQCLIQAPPLNSPMDEAAKRNLALCLATPPDYPMRNSILRKNEHLSLRRRRSEGNIEEQATTANYKSAS